MLSDVEKLGQWLGEWRVFCALEDDVDDGSEVDVAGGVMTVGEDVLNFPVESGQIRLLRPSCAATAARPRYVAVLEVLEDGAGLVAPFSPLGEPATPEEWRTGLDHMHLRVVEVWNACRVSAAHIDDGWSVAVLSPEDMCSLRMLHSGGCVDDERVGVALVHASDPRREYMRRERFWMRRWALSVRYGGDHANVEALPRAAERVDDGRKDV